MSKTLELPQAIAIALSTERLEFLRGLSNDELAKQEDVLELIRLLIEDRVKLRKEITILRDSMVQLDKLTTSVRVKSERLGSILDGQEWSIEE